MLLKRTNINNENIIQNINEDTINILHCEKMAFNVSCLSTNMFPVDDPKNNFIPATSLGFVFHLLLEVEQKLYCLPLLAKLVHFFALIQPEGVQFYQ